MSAPAAKPAATQEEEFFFPGSGEFKPVTIKAKNLEEATEKWEKIKEKE